MRSLKLELSLGESNALKGIALILLLIHHVFYTYTFEYNDLIIGDVRFIHSLGKMGNACVALFVFLSGYALGVTNPVKSAQDIVGFYKRRFKKLFINYWLIWLLFVPVGIWFFHRTFTDIYAEPVWKYFLLDFFGLISITGYESYNGTWWFYGCIVLLYIAFPIITLTVKRWPFLLWLYIIYSIVIIFFPVRVPLPIQYYLLPFLLGYALSYELHLSRYPVIQKTADWLFSNMLLIGVILAIILVAVISIRLSLKLIYALFWNTIIAILIVLIYKCLNINAKFNTLLGFLGKHSFNIYLFHYFILAFFPFLFNWSRNPAVIFLSLLISCIVISIGLERLKKITRLNRL